VWHPYSAIGADALPPVVAVGARGAWLTVIDRPVTATIPSR